MIAWTAVALATGVSIMALRDNKARSYILAVGGGAAMLFLRMGAMTACLVLATGSRRARLALRNRLYRGEHRK